MRPFAQIWRSAVAGLCFATFWLLTLLAAPTALAVLVLATPDRNRRGCRVRHLVSFGLRLLVRLAAALRIVECRIEGEHWRRAARGRLIVANHPSFLDAIAILAALPDANCVVKQRLRHHPLFAPFVRAGAYLGKPADPVAVIEQCRHAHERGEPILIFPEGTRTRPGDLPRFRRGAAQIALRAGIEILPATISCTPPALTHGKPWFRMPAQQVRLVVRFHAPRKADAFASFTGLDAPRAARCLTRGLQDYFIKELTLSDHADTPTPLPAAQCEPLAR